MFQDLSISSKLCQGLTSRNSNIPPHCSSLLASHWRQPLDVYAVFIHSLKDVLRLTSFPLPPWHPALQSCQQLCDQPAFAFWQQGGQTEAKRGIIPVILSKEEAVRPRSAPALNSYKLSKNRPTSVLSALVHSKQTDGKCLDGFTAYTLFP